MRMKMHNAMYMNAAANTAEASSCACSVMNIVLILDAIMMASIIVSLIGLAGLLSLLALVSLLALLLVSSGNVRLKDKRPNFT